MERKTVKWATKQDIKKKEKGKKESERERSKSFGKKKKKQVQILAYAHAPKTKMKLNCVQLAGNFAYFVAKLISSHFLANW